MLERTLRSVSPFSLQSFSFPLSPDHPLQLKSQFAPCFDSCQEGPLRSDHGREEFLPLLICDTAFSPHAQERARSFLSYPLRSPPLPRAVLFGKFFPLLNLSLFSPRGFSHFRGVPWTKRTCRDVKPLAFGLLIFLPPCYLFFLFWSLACTPSPGRLLRRVFGSPPYDFFM